MPKELLLESLPECCVFISAKLCFVICGVGQTIDVSRESHFHGKERGFLKVEVRRCVVLPDITVGFSGRVASTVNRPCIET